MKRKRKQKGNVMIKTGGEIMDAKFRMAKDLRKGDVFAMKNSDISFHGAKVIFVKSKGVDEIEINYEFTMFGTTYPRRDLLSKNSYVLMIE